MEAACVLGLRHLLPRAPPQPLISGGGCAVQYRYGYLVGTDLSDRQRPGHVDQRKVTGADGRGNSRRGTKAKRSAADDLVASGAPLVLDMYGTGQFEWFDGEDAERA